MPTTPKPATKVATKRVPAVPEKAAAVPKKPAAVPKKPAAVPKEVVAVPKGTVAVPKEVVALPKETRPKPVTSPPPKTAPATPAKYTFPGPPPASPFPSTPASALVPPSSPPPPYRQTHGASAVSAPAEETGEEEPPHGDDGIEVDDSAVVPALPAAATAAAEARATAELMQRYKTAVMRAVPCVYEDYFKLDDGRVCAPFPAKHVQMGTIVGGKDNTWWRAIPRVSGGMGWKEIVATENVHCLQIATQTVTDKKGRTLPVRVAITTDILDCN